MDARPSVFPVRLGLLLAALLSGVLLLLFVSMHTTIVRAALSLMGVRTDAAQILSVESPCGTVFQPAAAWREDWSAASVWTLPPCEEGGKAPIVTVRFSVPHNGSAALFLNDWLEVVAHYGEGAVASRSFTLREGVNRLAVLTQGKPIAHPFANYRGSPAYDPPPDQYFASLSAELWITAPARDLSRPRPLTGYRDSEGNARTIEMGLPGTGNPPVGQDGMRVTVAQNAFGDAAASDPPPLFRHLWIMRREDRLHLRFRACLPTTHPFMAMARLKNTAGDRIETPPECMVEPLNDGSSIVGTVLYDHGALRPTEALARLYGLTYRGRGSNFSVDKHRFDDPVRVNVFFTEGDCYLMCGSLDLPERALWFEGSGFMSLARDRLYLENVGPDRKVIGIERLRRGQNEWHGQDWIDPPHVQIIDWGSPVSPPDDGEQHAGTTDEQATALSTIAPRRAISQLSANVDSTLPWHLGSALTALLATLPVLLMLQAAWLMRKFRPVQGIINALAGLALAMMAVAVQTVVFSVYIDVSTVSGLGRLLPGATEIGGFGAERFAPAAILVAILIVPTIRRNSLIGNPDRDVAFWQTVIVGFGLLCATAIAFMLLVESLFDILDTLSAAESSTPQPVLTIAAMLVLWFFVALVVAVTCFRLSLRHIAPGTNVTATAVVAACALVIFPALPLLVGLPGLGGAIAGIGETGWLIALGNLIAPLATLILVYLLLRAFIVIAAYLSLGTMRRWIDRFATGRIGWAIALVLSLPMFLALFTGTSTLDQMAVTVIGAFGDYGIFIAMITPISLLIVLERNRAECGLRPFTPDEILDQLMALVFAGYLTVWHGSGTVAWPVLALIGYFAIRRLALTPQAQDGGLPTVDSDMHLRGAKLMAAIDEQSILTARIAAFDKKFSEGSVDREIYKTEIASLRARLDVIDENFPEGKTTLKRLLLASGPGDTPLHNAWIGAGFGLIVAILLEAIEVSGGSSAGLDIKIGWLSDILEASGEIDPRSTGSGLQAANPIFALLTSLLLVIAKWPVLGFVFGALFHRLRGDDGFSKALVFGGVTALAVLLSFLAAQSSGEVLDAGSALFGLIALAMLFLNILGAFVFDILTLHRLGLGIGALRRIYGVGGLVSHASIVAFISTIQAIFAAIKLMG